MTRIHRTSITSRNRQITVEIKGGDMGNRGPKRLQGIERYANGRPKADARSVKERQNDYNFRNIREAQSVVLKQPHRRGCDDPVLHSALGRFCRRTGCSKETISGVEAYAVTHQRWLVAMGKPRGLDNVSSIGSGEGPSAEQVKRWKARIDEVDAMLMRSYRPGVVGLVLRLAVDQVDLSEAQFEACHGAIRSAFGEIAVCMGFLEKNPHPFR